MHRDIAGMVPYLHTYFCYWELAEVGSSWDVTSVVTCIDLYAHPMTIYSFIDGCPFGHR